MTPSNASRSANDRPPMSEAAVEQLLGRFFAREVPADLPRGDDVGSRTFGSVPPVVVHASSLAQTSTERSSSLRPAARSSSGAVSIVAAAAVLLAVIALFRGSPRIDGMARTRPTGTSVRSSSVADSAAPAESNIGGLSVSERIEPVETFRFDSEHGPVEQRSERRITNVTVMDPETGSRVELELPELTIEIIPIKE